MNLSKMQDLLNGLEAFFKVFTYPRQNQITLRVFYDTPAENPGCTDVIYDMEGNYVKNV